jgi:hypothetical protein
MVIADSTKQCIYHAYHTCCRLPIASDVHLPSSCWEVYSIPGGQFAVTLPGCQLHAH